MRNLLIAVVVFLPSILYSDIKLGVGIGLDYMFDDGLFQKMKNSLDASGSAAYNQMLANGHKSQYLTYTAPQLLPIAFNVGFTVWPERERGIFIHYNLAYSGMFWSIDYDGFPVKEHEAVEIGNFYNDLNLGYEIRLFSPFSLSFSAGLSYTVISLKGKSIYTDNLVRLFSYSDSSELVLVNLLGANGGIALNFDLNNNIRLALESSYKWQKDLKSEFVWTVFSLGLSIKVII